jgi:hypothetical protein
MFSTEEIDKALKECQEAQRWNLGPRVEITEVEGVIYPRTQILFHDKLTPKQQKYVNSACNCGHMYDICGIGRIMNQKDCDFHTAAKQYFTSNRI